MCVLYTNFVAKSPIHMYNAVIPVGIDDMALYVPHLFLDIATLARQRGIEPEKLTRGLDLSQMAVPDTNEDAATMAAHAILTLFQNNQLDPRHIGRIYMGTESALDAAKPTASYAVGMIEAALHEQYGPRAMRHCDVVDMTFACIAATDALQNCLDYVRLRPEKYAIVVASDIAKYELNSTGEYTQGAGAVAMLITSAPRLLAFDDAWGVSTESVHDFFKPRRAFSKTDAVQAVLAETDTENDTAAAVAARLTQKQASLFGWPDTDINVFRETPVFDGQYSNQCYVWRAQEAMQDFRAQAKAAADTLLFDRWRRVICHLPYAAHGRRIGIELLAHDLRCTGQLGSLEAEANTTSPDPNAPPKVQAAYIKALSQTPTYQHITQQKFADAQLASSLVGNMYTGSIFLALMSALEAELTHTDNPDGATYGFVAYGSGSKSKVFEATIQPQWRTVVARFGVIHMLQNRQSISFEQYENLHCGKQYSPLSEKALIFGLESIGTEGQLEGTRSYRVELLK